MSVAMPSPCIGGVMFTRSAAHRRDRNTVRAETRSAAHRRDRNTVRAETKKILQQIGLGDIARVAAGMVGLPDPPYAQGTVSSTARQVRV